MKNWLKLWIAVLAVCIHSAAPLLADGKMYAREKVPTTIPYQRGLDPEDFVERIPWELKYLHKFKATLTPAQMEKDIGFHANPAERPFREQIKHW